jgi:putative DNA-invertase from lambdoid prophage Rac
MLDSIRVETPCLLLCIENYCFLCTLDENQPMTKNVFIYARVSTDKQTSESQVQELLEYCYRRGWGKPTVVEDTASGIASSRSGLDQLMTLVRRGKVDAVLAFKLDRLGRSLQHLVQIINEMIIHKVALIIPGQGIDTSIDNPAAKLQLSILGAVAEFERAVIRDRVLAGLVKAKQKGVKLGRRPTLANHYSEALRLSAQGMSGRQIANALGVPVGSVFHLLRQAKVAA